jgi:hypothetical protein
LTFLSWSSHLPSSRFTIHSTTHLTIFKLLDSSCMEDHCYRRRTCVFLKIHALVFIICLMISSWVGSTSSFRLWCKVTRQTRDLIHSTSSSIAILYTSFCPTASFQEASDSRILLTTSFASQEN